MSVYLSAQIYERKKRTVVCCPSHGLRTVPTGERVRGKARVDESEVGTVEHMVQVVIVVVHLRRRELTLVNDVLGRERTDVEALRERTSDRGQVRQLKLTIVY